MDVLNRDYRYELGFESSVVHRLGVQLSRHALCAVLQLLRLEDHHRLRLRLHGRVHLAVREKNQLWDPQCG